MILAINTSTPRFSLALLEEGGTLAGEIYLSTGKRHFGGLFPSVDFLFSSVGARHSDISCVAVAIGPGSFTGVRVGLAAAKGLAHALRVPIAGVSSLEALASQVFQSSLPVTALMESRRNDVFAAQFQWVGEGQIIKTVEEQCLRYESLKFQIKLPSIFIGSDYETQSLNLRKAINHGLVLAPAHMWCLKASSVGYIGLARYEAGQTDDPATLAPIYLRPPDIRPNPYFRTDTINKTGASIKD